MSSVITTMLDEIVTLLKATSHFDDILLLPFDQSMIGQSNCSCAVWCGKSSPVTLKVGGVYAYTQGVEIYIYTRNVGQRMEDAYAAVRKALSAVIGGAQYISGCSDFTISEIDYGYPQPGDGFDPFTPGFYNEINVTKISLNVELTEANS